MAKLAVLYARVSSDKQAEGYSVPTQLEACRKYAEEHGLAIVGNHYVDLHTALQIRQVGDGWEFVNAQKAEEREADNKDIEPIPAYLDDYTGASLERPGLNELRDFIAREAVEAVIVYDLDRLSRKAVYQMLLEEEFAKAGVGVHYVLGQYEDTPEGNLQKQIKAAISEYERAKITERIKRGLKGKAKAGYVVVGARPPYGYQVQSEPHKNWLVVDEDEARVVRLIFQWYVNGDEEGKPLSIRAIARKLTALQIPTRGDKVEHVKKRHKRCVWQPGVVSKILKRETYAGVWHYNKNDFSDGQSTRPPDEWIPVEVPAIIDHSLWEQAQARLEYNKSFAPRNTKWPYLLQHRLTCLACGCAVTCFTKVRPSGRATSYYRCSAAMGQVTGHKCQMPHFRADQLEPAIWGWVSNLLLHPDQLAEGLRAQQTEAKRASQALQDRLTLVEKHIAEHDRQIEKLLELYLSSEDFPKELLREKRARLTKAKQDLEKERSSLARHLEQIIIPDTRIEEIEEFCGRIREGLKSASFEDKRQILELLDVQGKLAVEDGRKVVYVNCIIDQTRLAIVSPAPH